MGAVGGAGTASSITGSSVTRAGGGAGGSATGNSTAASGGSGGGGSGGPSNVHGGAGTVNTGSGGGGGGRSYGGANANGGLGGSGVVILKIPDASYSGTTSGSPTVDTASVADYTILIFNGNGSYTA